MTTKREWLIELPSGEVAALRCSEDSADKGERDGLWTVIGSAYVMTLAEARQVCANA